MHRHTKRLAITISLLVGVGLLLYPRHVRCRRCRYELTAYGPLLLFSHDRGKFFPGLFSRSTAVLSGGLRWQCMTYGHQPVTLAHFKEIVRQERLSKKARQQLELGEY